jgi:DNA end-binding protein Ku
MAAAKKHKKAEPNTAHRPGAKEEHHKALPAPKIPGLSARPVWQGHLRLSLVSCPVALYKATTKTNDISFNLINPETNNRIKMVPTDPETGPVNRSDLVRGYEFEKNRYVIIDEDELDAVKLETTHTLDIERFVDADTIDRLFWDVPYVLLPTDDIASQAYSVIREAMASTNRIALGRVAMHSRERLMAIEVREHGLVASSLRMRDEVVSMSKALEAVPHRKADSQMVDIAERIISQLEGPFNPDEFTDRYEEALRDLIRRKQKGEKPTVSTPAAEPSNVVDLMAMLKKSLEGKASGKHPPKTAAAASKSHRKRAR